MNSKKNGFIMQAGILAFAGIIVRMIGILYRSPLTAIIGDEGNGYYSTAYTIYTIILLISSYSIPAAISKVIAARLAKGEYKNAHKIFVCSFIYVIMVGGVGSLCCFFFAESLVGVNSAMVLRVFSPTIFLSGLLGVLRGYFQAHRTMLPTSFSQIIEQILNAIVSIGAAFLLMNLVSDQDATTQAIYGAIGSAMGTGAGVLIALIFMIVVYRSNSALLKKQRKHDHTRNTLEYGQVFKIIISMVTPVVLSTCIYNLSNASNLKIYYTIYENIKGYTEIEATTMYGLFSGKATQLANIPIAIASAMSAALIPTIARTHEAQGKKETNRKIASAIKTTMLVSIPSMVGLMVLAKPIVILLYPQKDSVQMVTWLLQSLAITVVLYGLSTLTNAILQGIGKVNIPVINATVALIIQTIVLVILLLGTECNLFALAIAAIVYSFTMCILNGLCIRKQLSYHQEIYRTFFLPFLSTIGMGGVAYGVYEGMSWLIRLIVSDMELVIWGWHNALCLLITIIISAITYFLLLFKFGGLTKKEIKAMPKGHLIIKVLSKFHIIS